MLEVRLGALIFFCLIYNILTIVGQMRTLQVNLQDKTGNQQQTWAAYWILLNSRVIYLDRRLCQQREQREMHKVIQLPGWE